MHIYVYIPICLYFVLALNLTFLWNWFYALLLSAWATINYLRVGLFWFFLQAGLNFFLRHSHLVQFHISSLPARMWNPDSHYLPPPWQPWAFLNPAALCSPWNLSILIFLSWAVWALQCPSAPSLSLYFHVSRNKPMHKWKNHEQWDKSGLILSGM